MKSLYNDQVAAGLGDLLDATLRRGGVCQGSLCAEFELLIKEFWP
jgi:hypothetical protein